MKNIIFTKSHYPDLKLLEYIAKEKMLEDARLKKKFELIKEENQCKKLVLSFECEVFNQSWENSSLAFDEETKGYAGQMLYESYTTVFHEKITNIYIVFVNNKIAYIVTEPTETFFNDLHNRNLNTVSYAKKYY